VLVYPDADATPELITQHKREYQLPMPSLRDPAHAWVERTGVTVTPEVVVFDAQHRVAYRGRIDDRFPQLGSARSEASVHDLALALEALERGDQPKTRTAPAIGCPIPKLGAH
jgi:hypothetical protein